MPVLQFPSSVTPVCSPPSHLWTASGSLWSVHPGRSVCPAELWAREVREGASRHWTKFKWIKSEKKNWERQHGGRVSVWFTLCLCESLLIWCLSWFSGDFRVVLYEKSCILPSLCGVTGEKHTMGLNFTFTNECCNTHLCNGAATPATPFWTGTLLTLLISYSVWWIEEYLRHTWSGVALSALLMDWHCTQLPFSNFELICAKPRFVLTDLWGGKIIFFSNYC